MSAADGSDREGVFVVGVGACTPVGTTASQSAAAVRAGIARFVEHPYIVDQAGEPAIVALASYVPAGLSWVDRLAALALSASREALRALAPARARGVRIPVLVGVPAERSGVAVTPRFGEQLAARLREASGEEGAGIAGADVFPCGHAGGLSALDEGCRRIRAKEADIVLAGGCECYLTRRTLAWLDAREQLKSRDHRFGFVPGEAAGFCLLASARAVARYSLPTLARIVAVAIADEPSRRQPGTVNTGLGLTSAIRAVLARLPPEQRVDAVLCDLNGERYRVDEYGFTLSRLADRFVDPSAFEAPATCWGDVGAASGPLCVCIATAAAQRGYARGPTTLVWAGSEAGERAALLLETTVRAMEH
ncbi:beta-ketoacyl synthase N-terminal-like domain-containing protein [Sorangium sp. So ce429]